MAAVTRLAIMRHATAVGHAETDWDRPLSEHGHVQAQAAGRWLIEHAFQPTCAVVSSSMRTRQTYEALGVSLAARVSDTAYNANAAILAGLIGECADTQAVLLVAHNPGVSDLARLCGAERALTPGSIVLVGWEGTAGEFEPAATRIEAVFEPA